MNKLLLPPKVEEKIKELCMMTKDRSLQFDTLLLDFEDLYQSLGKNYTPDETIQSMLNSLRVDIATRCNPQYHYSMFQAIEGKKNHVRIGDAFLHTGGTITPFLENADCYVLFVATAGTKFENYQSEVKKSGDIVQEFLLDIYGSAIVESVVREMCKDAENEMSKIGYGVSYPYSPGYCGWHVKTQQTLFSLLPKNPAGVSLNESSLMIPIKSVSGIIAVGKNITKQKYGCEICTKTDCYKNRNESNILKK